MEVETLEEPPVNPVYQQSRPNETIALNSFNAKYFFNSTEYRSLVNARMDFLRNPKITIEIPCEETSSVFFGNFFSADDNANFRLLMAESDLEIKGFCIGANFDSKIIKFNPNTSRFPITIPTKKIRKSVAHLINFPLFHSRKEGGDFILKYHKGARVCGRTVIDSGDWKIILSEFEGSRNIVKSLSEEGGYAITHVLGIEKNDGTDYSDSELKQLLDNLHDYFSFVIGRWPGVSFPVGYDANGDCVYEELGCGLVSRDNWKKYNSWFDDMLGSSLAEIWPGFQKLLSRSPWDKRFREVLWWYVAANERGQTITTDMAIVLSHSALELLSWLHCVKDRRLVSEQAFKPNALRASDKLRMLASSLNVPSEIPESLEAIKGIKQNPFEDIPHVISEIRNSVVHPDPKRELDSPVFFEGWKLSMWYLDTIILALCGHNGKYRNRLIAEVETVPWAPSTS